MSITEGEAKEAIRVFREEVEANFPGQNPYKLAAAYCQELLVAKMQKLLAHRFAFRDPLALIEILRQIQNEETRTAVDESGAGTGAESIRKPGRPKKSKDSAPEV